jgi:hypothetical protein
MGNSVDGGSVGAAVGEEVLLATVGRFVAAGIAVAFEVALVTTAYVAFGLEVGAAVTTTSDEGVMVALAEGLVEGTAVSTKVIADEGSTVVEKLGVGVGAVVAVDTGGRVTTTPPPASLAVGAMDGQADDVGDSVDAMAGSFVYIP